MLKYMLIILDSMVNMIGGDLYAHLTSTRIFTLIMNKNIHTDSKYYEANDYGHNLDLLIISNLFRVHREVSK
jgi:hypothetical protein